jgi:hypothetical protein
MTRPLVVLPLLFVLCSCPEEEVDPRAFVEEAFRASVVCEPTFLAQAEPIFLRAQAEAQIEISVAGFERSLENEHVTFSRAAYDACFSAAKNNDCEVLDDAKGPCAKIFVGKLDDGDTCAEKVECADGLSCFQDRDACGVCRPLALAGESCADRNCVNDAVCGPDDICVPKPDNESFEEGGPCQNNNCGGVLTGLVCLANVCSPITIVDEGEACEIGAQADLYCKNSSTTHVCDNGVCTQRPGRGDACTGVCDLTEAVCVDGSCVDEGEPGDACTSPANCQLGSTCRDGACVALSDAPTPPVCE